MRSSKRWLLAGLVAVLLMALLVTPAAAQSDIILQVALPEFLRPLINPEAFKPFEEAHPGVQVKVVYTGFDSLFLAPPANDLDAYLDDLEKYVASADVLAVQNGNISIQATRAGYYLDLTPLTSADTTLKVDDFFPAAWASFQWDNGLWALPVSQDIISVVYNPKAFDEAGMAYPNENWTLNDFAIAARALSERDTAGKVTRPGMVTFQNERYFLRSLLEQGLYDLGVVPDAPAFSTDALQTLLTQWFELQEEGVISGSFEGDISEVPLKIIGSFGLGSFGGPDQTPSSASLLPGGLGGFDTQGVAVSSGTAYPELAYELASYMTQSAVFANNPFGVAPARRTLIGTEAPPPDDTGGAFIIGRPAFTPENQAVIDAGLENGLPLAELRYADYAVNALDNMKSDGLDAQAALQQAEAQAVANLQTAAERRTTTTVVVATPLPDVVVEPGQIILNFGVASFVQPFPNREQWDQIIRDFVAADPQVGQVNLDTGFGDASSFATKDDCFYLPFNAVPNLDLTTVIALDPYLDADPAFSRDDVVGNALELVRKDNQTWALPVVIQPEILRYNTELFERAGIPAPTDGWTIDQFTDALKALKLNPDDPKPFAPRGAGANYLLMLAAAYGGIPLDQRTSPPTINYTDPASIDALRQVLDLAKAGYIDYQEQARTEFNITLDGDVAPPPIYTESLNGFGVQIVIGEGDPNRGYGLATYPTGSQYNAVSYDMGAAYISASSQNPDACYRWISVVAQHPELFSAMPARRSFINDPAYAASTDADTIALYNRFDQLMADPNTINFQSPFGGGTNPGNFIVQFWLFRAFDNYILRDADLETELTTAHTNAVAYQECVAAILPFDPAARSQEDYFRQFGDCAAQIDPSMGSLFAGPGG